MSTPIVWKPVDDGEHNEETTTVSGRHVTIFSDRSADQWCCQIDDAEFFCLDATDRPGARQEAIREAVAWGSKDARGRAD